MSLRAAISVGALRAAAKRVVRVRMEICMVIVG